MRIATTRGSGQTSESPTVRVVNDHSRNHGQLRASRATGSYAARACILLLAALTLNVFATTVWTWVDEKGVTHYSQTPPPGAREAKRVEIGPSNRAVPHTPRSSPNTPAGRLQAPPPVAKQKYTEFTIVQPADGATLWNVAGVVPVQLRLDPKLRPGHGIVLYLDDRRLDHLAPTLADFELKDVYLGTHLLVAVIHDQERASLQEAAVTFHVRQASIKPKPVQPLPKQN